MNFTGRKNENRPPGGCVSAAPIERQTLSFAEQLETSRAAKEADRKILEARLELIDEQIAGLDADIAWLKRNPRLEGVLRAIAARRLD